MNQERTEVRNSAGRLVCCIIAGTRVEISVKGVLTVIELKNGELVVQK